MANSAISKISIIILNYKTPELTLNCINSIIANSKEMNYEIVLIDNASGVQSKKYFDLNLPNTPDIKIIYLGKNLGFGNGNNIGAKSAEGDYLLFLNSDILFFENSLKILLEEFENMPQNNKIGFIQPRLYLNDKKTNVQKTCAMLPNILDLFQENLPLLQKIRTDKFKKFKYQDWDRNSSRFIDTVCGAAMFCKKEFFETIGGFDKRYFLYFEEFDLCKRVKMLNFKNFYTTKTSMIHLHNMSPNPSVNKKIIYVHSFLKYITKHYVKI